jgi:exopolyphosphatase/guanosine-5'-triphosphate,3'-diphosphate pyrophosphatase
MEEGKAFDNGLGWGRYPGMENGRDDAIGAVIELGANSVKFLAGKVLGKNRIQVISHKRQITRLSENLQQSGELAESAMQRTLSCVEEFKHQAEEAGAERFAIFATHPLRVASNAGVFIDEVRSATGLETRVLSGEEEAFATRSGVMLNYDKKAGGEPVIIDIGGGSTEVVLGIRSKSMPMGCVNLTESLITSDPPSDRDIIRITSKVRDFLIDEISFITPGKRLNCISVGGTAITLAALHHKMKIFDSMAVHGTKISRKELNQQLEHLSSITLDLRKEILCFDPDRADVIIAGLIILHTFFSFISAEEFAVSVYNIIHGVFYEHFSKRLPVQGE